MMKTRIVTGLGFGDEGKGRVTSYLCSLAARPLVVRYCGGHNAGHTVVINGQRHIFSSFGSGTLQGTPTWWTRFCTFSPTAFCNEYHALRQMGHLPFIKVDGLCPVTTPYDIYANHAEETGNRHGSVGVGVGKTFERQAHFYKLFVQDMFYPSVFRAKLNNIGKYYGRWAGNVTEDMINAYLEDVEEAASLISLSTRNITEGFDTLIFEGAQGILLDQDFGFFPNVTRSNTSSKNAMTLITELGLPRPELWYITRCYQTRHGNGFMTNEGELTGLLNNEHETNQTDTWQGNFRTGLLDIDLLNYALTCDKHFTAGCLANLVVTCADQTGEEFMATLNGRKIKINPLQLAKKLQVDFEKVLFSKSDSGGLEF
jgi:adenylosuccinate synthase